MKVLSVNGLMTNKEILFECILEAENDENIINKDDIFWRCIVWKYIKNDSDYYDNIEIEGNDELWDFYGDLGAEWIGKL